MKKNGLYEVKEHGKWIPYRKKKFQKFHLSLEFWPFLCRTVKALELFQYATNGHEL